MASFSWEAILRQERNETIYKVIEDLTCKVCFNYAKPGEPWYRCSSLHALCHTCVERGRGLTRCPPPCDCQFSDQRFEFLRNGAFVPFCFTDHLLQEATPRNFYPPRKLYQAFGKIFISSAEIKDGVLYAWLQLLGPTEEAEKFTFRLEYQGPWNPPYDFNTHAFSGKVSSIDETQDAIISSGRCSSIGFETFKTKFMQFPELMMSPGNCMNALFCTYSYSVTIKKE